MLPAARLQPTSVESSVQEALKLLRVPDHVEIKLQFPPQFPHVLADANQLPMVFRNLLRNATDAMPNGGRVAVSGARLGCQVEISVADTGSGMPAELVERVLDPLYTTKPRGMGLGLAIVKVILEKHQAELAINSEVGVGSTFTIRLNAADLKGPADSGPDSGPSN